MEKPGIRTLRNGLICVVAGGALAATSLVFFQGAFTVIFYGVILVGGVLMLVGLGRRAAWASRSPEVREREDTRTIVVTLVRAMVVVANADGWIEEAEVRTICDICEELTGRPLSPGEVRDLAEKIGRGGGDLHAFIGSLGAQLSVEDRVLVARACHSVMTSDGEMSVEEKLALREILDALRLPGNLLGPDTM